MGKRKISDKEILSKKWGFLTPINIVFRQCGDRRRKYVYCECDCGNFKEASCSSMLRGDTQSCGCKQRQMAKEKNTKHGLRKHPLYEIWKSMRQRCHNKKQKQYKDYGGRGIAVIEEWDNFQKFYDFCINNGWIQGLDIDRINNDRGYCPDNCHFVTRQINNENRRLIRNTNKTGFTGVSYHKDCKKYTVSVTHKGKNLLHTTRFKYPLAAAFYRDRFIIENNLPHKLNFPELER